MAGITFSENHDSKFLAFEEGRSLASKKNPQEEALKWVYSLGPFPSNHVVIIGLGSGYHISALVDLEPGVKVTVVDSRESLVSIFRKQFPELKDKVNILMASNVKDLMSSQMYCGITEDRAFVISFRECWGQQIPLFSEFFAHLTGRTVESVKYHLAEIGINMKALFVPQRAESHKLWSIKDVLPVVEASILPEDKKQIFRILGELVK
jgi:hypothetical protein